MMNSGAFAQDKNTETAAELPQKTEETKILPTKETFLAAWEVHQRNLPTTVTLEKTNEPGIYNYETTLFPYKGKLKINNILISKDIYYYGDYDLNLEDALKGVVETELPDLQDKKMYDLYPYSNNIWKNQNFLFYNGCAGKWLNIEQWREIQKSNTRASQETLTQNQLIADFLPLVFLIPFLLLLLWWAKRQQKAQMTKFDLSLERQEKSMALQKESMASQKESLELQKELVELLRRNK